MTQTFVAQPLDRSKPPKGKEPKDVKFPEYFDTTLSNGINLIVVENYKVPSVSVRLVFKDAGSYNDREIFGLASLTAELLTKGTKNRTATQIAEEIDFLGGTLSSGCDWDGSFITLSILKKHLDKGIDVLSDVVQNPVFDEEEIKRVKEQRLASIIQAKDDANNLADKMFNKVVFGTTPYAYPSEGNESTINSLSKENFSGFYKKKYQASHLVLAFVGAISKEEALKIVSDKFISLKNNGDKKFLADNLPTNNPTGVYIVDKPGAVQSSIRVGHIGIPRNNPDFIALSVMNTILGGYFSSRINYTLREKHGYTYGARSSFNPRMHSGDFSVDTDVRNEVTDSSVTLIIKELKRIVSEEVTDEELQKVKNYLTGIFPLQLETANAVASRVINLKLYGLPKGYYDNYISNIKKLTKKDLLDVAEKYIHPENLYIVLSGNSKEIKDKMKKFGEVKVFDADGIQIK